MRHTIFCRGCSREVEARLTTGAEVYPHRPDLADLPFWRCDTCRNFVGTHHKTGNRTRPLGSIPTKELTNARKHIHGILDPVWKSGKMPRGRLYARISEALGYPFHAGEINTIEEARRVYVIVRNIASRLA